MRYYGEEYLQEAHKTISACRSAIDSPNYASAIRDTSVSDKREGLKEYSVQVAQNAYTQMNQLFDKLAILQNKLSVFYSEVDSTAAGIVQTTDTICELIKKATASMTEISSMLRGVGDYAGVEITSKDIASAGLDKDACKQLAKKAWAQLIDTGVKNDYLNETAALSYVAIVKADENSGGELSREDFDRLMKLYDYYVAHRYGVWNNIRNLKGETIQNLIDVFEILNPYAQYCTDVFFDTAISGSPDNELVKTNVNRIKYTIYTAPEKYRDIMIHYMKDVYVSEYRNGTDDSFNSAFNSLNLDLAGDFDDGRDINYNTVHPFDSFFHEFGHAIDDLSTPFSHISNGFMITLALDLREHMAKIAEKNQISISQDDMNEVFDYMLSAKRPNVVTNVTSYMDYLPKSWNSDQVGLFALLRVTYGGVDLRLLDDHTSMVEPFGDNNSLLKEEPRFELISDIIGGLTNNKIGGWEFAHHVNYEYGDREFKSDKDLISYMESEHYWYNFGKNRDTVEYEFFAEYFNNKVIGYGIEESRDVFSFSCDKFDKAIDKIYKELPECDKGFHY